MDQLEVELYVVSLDLVPTHGQALEGMVIHLLLVPLKEIMVETQVLEEVPHIL